MKVFEIPVQGVFEENCYIYLDEQTSHAFLIDPGAQPEKILHQIREHEWTIDAILLTHGHFDHIGAVNTLRAQLNVPVYGSDKILMYSMNPHLNLSARYGLNIVVSDVQKLHNLSVVSSPFIKAELRAIAVPGHTEDSMLYYDSAAHIAFCGDAIFKGQPGLWTFPTGNKEQLLNSIYTHILGMPSDTVLLSGHTAPTTVGEERKLYPPMNARQA